MSYFESSGAAPYTSYSSTTAASGLAYLRQRSFPEIIEAPRFGGEVVSEWIDSATALFGRYLAIAAVVVGFALLAAAAVPAFAAGLQPTSTTSRLGTVHSSAGITGTAGSHVADLNVGTFVGGLPFVHQSQVLSANTSSGVLSSPESFVAGVRESRVADYVQNVGMQMVLPYLSDTAATKESVEAWSAAIAQQQAIANAPAAAYRFQAPALAPGTVIPGARATFYSCIDNGFCDTMASGLEVFPGAAACSNNLPFGTRFYLNADPTRTVYTCLDRGVLAPTWVDIWFYDAADGWAWQSMVGANSAITIVE